MYQRNSEPNHGCDSRPGRPRIFMNIDDTDHKLLLTVPPRLLFPLWGNVCSHSIAFRLEPAYSDIGASAFLADAPSRRLRYLWGLWTENR